MISRCIALLIALLLAGCCATGNGCNTPVATGPIAWDGLGPAPLENTVGADSTPTASGPVKHKRARQITTQADSKPQSDDPYAQRDAADQDADVKLNAQLKICRNC